MGGEWSVERGGVAAGLGRWSGLLFVLVVVLVIVIESVLEHDDDEDEWKACGGLLRHFPTI